MNTEAIAATLYSHLRVTMGDCPRLRLSVGVSQRQRHTLTVNVRGVIQDTNMGVEGEMAVWMEEAIMRPHFLALEMRCAILDAHTAQVRGRP